MFKMTDNFFTKYIFFFNFDHDNNSNIILFKLFNFFYVLKNFDYDFDKSKKQDLIKLAVEEANKPDINDQSKYLADQKVEVLKSIN